MSTHQSEELQVRSKTINNNTLPETWRLLSAEETKRFSLYKHKGTKTFLENLLVNTIVKFTERIYPDSYNANFVTLMGQIP